MSKVSIQGDQNGTGVFSLKAPNSNTDRTLTLPDEAGSVLTDVSDIEPQVKTATNATGSAPIYACRAWVNFDATNLTIRGSGNVSSILEAVTGYYVAYYVTNMPDLNHSMAWSAGNPNNNDFRFIKSGGRDADASFQQQAEVLICDENFNQTDAEFVFLQVVR